MSRRIECEPGTKPEGSMLAFVEEVEPKVRRSGAKVRRAEVSASLTEPTDDQLNVRGILSQSGRNEGVFPVADRIVGLFSERLAERDELASIMRVLRNENRLKCVVDGVTAKDGNPAPLCPDICSGAQMCAGCRARVWCEQNGTSE